MKLWTELNHTAHCLLYADRCCTVHTVELIQLLSWLSVLNFCLIVNHRCDFILGLLGSREYRQSGTSSSERSTADGSSSERPCSVRCKQQDSCSVDPWWHNKWVFYSLRYNQIKIKKIHNSKKNTWSSPVTWNKELYRIGSFRTQTKIKSNSTESESELESESESNRPRIVLQFVYLDM